MPRGTRCRALVSLCLLALACAAAPASAKLPHGAVRLARADYKSVRHGAQCGRIAGRWVSGTRVMAWWFVSDARQARNYAARGQAKRAAFFRRRAAARRVACGPLRISIRGAHALALRRSSRFSGHDLSNLDVVGRRGRLRDAVTSGSANVARFYDAPNGKVYVLFRSMTRIDDGANVDQSACDDGSSDDGSADDTSSDDTSSDDGSSDDGSGDGSDARQVDPCSEDGAVYCLLAEVDPTTNKPTCVDTNLEYLRSTTVPGLNDAVQFDDQGAVYYLGQYGSQTFLRRSLDGKITNYLSGTDALINDFLALGDGDVLITGSTIPTGARWIRRIGLDGQVHNVRSFSANWMRKFPDGNAYIGIWGSGDQGVERFVPSTNAVDTRYWLGARADDPAYAIEDVCQDADADMADAFCTPRGSLLTDTATTSAGKVYAVAGTQSNARLVQLFPQVQTVPTGVHKVEAAVPVGDDVALAGVDDNDHQVLVLHHTADDTEQTLIGPDAELEAYHLAHDAKAGQLLFDGLRFSDDKYVLGRVDLATGAVTIDDSGTQAWTDIQTTG